MNEKKCDNGPDHGESVRECRACGGTFCVACREAISVNADRCPLCNGYVGDSDSCRLVGGCGR